MWVSYVSAVNLKQVVRGKEIAHGQASLQGLTCDGAEHTYHVDVFPDAGTATSPASAPFKKGDAVISAYVSNIYTPGQPSATAGPQTIRLR